MDLILVLLVVLVIGIPKLGNVSDDGPTMVMNKDGSIVQVNGDSEELPIGNNLMLKHEPDAFTMIIRELGLRK